MINFDHARQALLCVVFFCFFFCLFKSKYDSFSVFVLHRKDPLTEDLLLVPRPVNECALP